MATGLSQAALDYNRQREQEYAQGAIGQLMGTDYFQANPDRTRSFDLAAAIDRGDAPTVQTAVGLANTSPIFARQAIGGGMPVNLQGFRKVGEDQYVADLQRTRPRGGLLSAFREPVRETVPMTRDRSSDGDSPVRVFSGRELNEMFNIPLAAQQRRIGQDPTVAAAMEKFQRYRSEHAARPGTMAGLDFGGTPDSLSAPATPAPTPQPSSPVNGTGARRASLDPTAATAMNGLVGAALEAGADPGEVQAMVDEGIANPESVTDLAKAAGPSDDPEENANFFDLRAQGYSPRQARNMIRRRSVKQEEPETPELVVDQAEINQRYRDLVAGGMSRRQARGESRKLRVPATPPPEPVRGASEDPSRDTDGMTLRERIMEAEDFKPEPYPDGWNKDADGNRTTRRWSRGFGENFEERPEATTREAAEQRLDEQIADAETDAMRFAGPSWETMDTSQREALQELAYQLGAPTLNGFTQMKQAVRDGNWAEAADELVDSTMGREQTQGRARRLADALAGGTGQPPETGEPSPSEAPGRRPEVAGVAPNGSQVMVRAPSTPQETQELIQSGVAMEPSYMERVEKTVEGHIQNVEDLRKLPPEDFYDVVWAITTATPGTPAEKLELGNTLMQQAGFRPEYGIGVDDVLTHLGNAADRDVRVREGDLDRQLNREKATTDASLRLAELRHKQDTTLPVGRTDDQSRLRQADQKIGEIEEMYFKGEIEDDAYEAMINRQFRLTKELDTDFSTAAGRNIREQAVLQAFRESYGPAAFIRDFWRPEMPDHPSVSVMDHLVISRDGDAISVRAPGRRTASAQTITPQVLAAKIGQAETEEIISELKRRGRYY